jgi:ABC-2 type transport system permease protein
VNPGIPYLLHRTALGWLRLLRRRASTLKGALTLLVIAAFLALMLAPQLMLLVAGGPRVPADPAWVLSYVPVLLMTLAVVTAASGHALYFRPAEVDFLFPAPISRRELLLYQLASRVGVQLLSGLFMGVLVVRHAPLPAAGLLAVLLGSVLLHVLAQLLALLREAGVQRLGRRGARLQLPILGLLGVGALALAASWLPRGTDPVTALQLLAGSPLAQALALPVRPVAGLFVAADATAAARMTAAVLAVLSAGVGAILLLDVAISERALAVSRRINERLQRMRQGGAVSARGPIRNGLRVPELHFLGAAAPLAVRQLRELSRNPRGALIMLVGTLVWLGAVVGIPIYDSLRAGDPIPPAAAWAALGAALVAPFVLASQLAHDFRRDLDRMPMLKSLPLEPGAIAVGQIFTGAAVCTFVQALCAGLVVAMTGVLSWIGYAALVAVLPALAWTVVSVENTLFLLLPYRVAPGTSDGAQFMGRAIVTFFLKFLAIGLLLALAAGIAFAVWLASGRNWITAAVAGFAALAAGCIPLTWLTGRAFAGFDVSTDTP